MTAQLGYLLPTRENVMRGEHGTGDILALAQTAAGLGFDSYGLVTRSSRAPDMTPSPCSQAWPRQCPM